jgi:hypothetical protein
MRTSDHSCIASDRAKLHRHRISDWASLPNPKQMLSDLAPDYASNKLQKQLAMQALRESRNSTQIIICMPVSILEKGFWKSDLAKIKIKDDLIQLIFHRLLDI